MGQLVTFPTDRQPGQRLRSRVPTGYSRTMTVKPTTVRPVAQALATLLEVGHGDLARNLLLSWRDGEIDTPELVELCQTFLDVAGSNQPD